MYILMWSTKNYESGIIAIYRTFSEATKAARQASQDENPACRSLYIILHAEYGQPPTYVTSWNFDDLKEKDNAS
jgi:hypothetical protein